MTEREERLYPLPLPALPYLPVTIEAPGHRHGLGLFGLHHGRDVAVAGGTGDARGGMGAVVEAGVSGQALERLPCDRLVEPVAGTERSGRRDPPSRKSGWG